jgi:hypothetical protein
MTRFESSPPDSRVCSSDGRAPGSSPGGRPFDSGRTYSCRTNTTASVSAFQAGNAGSIPACGSRRCKHMWTCTWLLPRGHRVRGPGGARGRDGNWQTSRAQTSRHAGSDPAARTRWPLAELADPPGSEPRASWFEARVASFAAAHGCGPALVKRVIRVGTGWRLHVLVAQWQRHSVEDAASARSSRAEDTTPL